MEKEKKRNRFKIESDHSDESDQSDDDNDID